MLEFLIWAIFALALMIALYFVIDHYFPTYGTVIVNLIYGLPALAEQVLNSLGSLPWANILEPKQVGAIVFAIAFGNFIIRLRGPKKAVGSS